MSGYLGWLMSCDEGCYPSFIAALGMGRSALQQKIAAGRRRFYVACSLDARVPVEQMCDGKEAAVLIHHWGREPMGHSELKEWIGNGVHVR